MSGTKKHALPLGQDAKNEQVNKGIQKYFGKNTAGSWESDEEFARSLLTETPKPEELAPGMIPVSVYQVKNKEPLSFDRFSLELESSDLGEDTTGYLLMIEGTIMGHQHGAEPIAIGFVKAQLVKVDKVYADELNLWEIMDEHSVALSDIAKGFQAGGRNLLWSSENWKGRDHSFGNILYFQEISLEEPYRGHGIGLLAVDAMIGSLGSFQAAAPASFKIPLPFDKTITEAGKVDISEWDGNPETKPYIEKDLVLISAAGLGRTNLWGPNPGHDRTVQKLTDHWTKLGFYVLGRHVGVHDTLMALQTWFPRPEIGEVVPHLVATGQAGE